MVGLRIIIKGTTKCRLNEDRERENLRGTDPKTSRFDSHLCNRITIDDHLV